MSKWAEWAEWVEALWGFKVSCFFFQTDAEIFSFLSWKQKSFIPKKNIFLAVVPRYAKRDPKDGVCYRNF